jgi:hypothetical protein
MKLQKRVLSSDATKNNAFAAFINGLFGAIIRKFLIQATDSWPENTKTVLLSLDQEQEPGIFLQKGRQDTRNLLLSR